jgi:RND family efflux transporter MFP subunit
MLSMQQPSWPRSLEHFLEVNPHNQNRNDKSSRIEDMCMCIREKSYPWSLHSCRVLPTALAALLCAALLSVGGCVEREVEITELPPPKVVVSQPVVMELADYAEYSGRVEAIDNVEIRARVTGYLKKVAFREGDYVEKDDLLFEIDDRTYAAAVEAAKAEVDRMEAMVIKTNADLTRYKNLLAKEAATQQEYDTALGARDATAAELEAAKAAQKSAQIDLDFTKIYAPVNGRVSRALVTEGNLITADRAEGVPLTTIVSMKPISVYFDVDEYTINTVRAQRLAENPKLHDERIHVSEWKIPVFVGLSNEPGFPHVGFIDFADNRIDPETGTLRLRGRFPNDDQVLIAGAFVRVRLILSKPLPRILVPESAIGTELTQKYVYVVDADNVAQKRPVKVGSIRAGELRSIEDGVTADDLIMIKGLQLVRDGQAVTATTEQISPPEVAKPAELPANLEDTATDDASAGAAADGEGENTNTGDDSKASASDNTEQTDADKTGSEKSDAN